MYKQKFDKLIEIAKQDSKDDFLRFVTGIYGIDKCVFNHIWNVPIIAPFDENTLITTSLSTKTEDELLDIVDEFIASELGNADGCFILLNKLAVKFTLEELEEWQEKLDTEKLDYNAIIVYNEPKLKKQYNELLETNSAKEKPKTEEEIDQIFVEYVKGVITNEICLLNANYLVKNEKRSKILVDILRRMINIYHDGDSIEDCLFRIIKYKNGKSQYEYIDYKEVFTMYLLYPEELTEWAIFGAYDFIKQNKLQKMIIDVCSTNMQLQPNQLKKKVEEYIITLEDGVLSNKQIKMLEMLGFSTNKEIDKKDKEIFKNSNVSEKTNYLEVINKPNFIKRFLKKIYDFFKIKKYEE